MEHMLSIHHVPFPPFSRCIPFLWNSHLFYSITERNLVSGTPEEIAVRLRDFASVGNSHLIVALDAVTPASIEQLGHIAELARQL